MKLISLSILAGLATALPTHHPDQYEYIIIGSGPGGGTLAANLARAGHSVFLIEAGGNQGNTPLQRIPAMQVRQYTISDEIAHNLQGGSSR
ncbi:hypothetical protein FVER14953_20734 [Fusarium verticillioides]|nr:hypothetical protein FVER14953_20734 [Fusarium verticillioides]